MKRRAFIKTAGILATACLITERTAAMANAPKSKLPSFGLIPGNTGGKWFENDPVQALRAIAEMGYSELEFGGSFGLDKKAAKDLLKELGITPLLGSVDMKALSDKDEIMKAVELCHEFEKPYIVCYWPWTADGQGKKIDDWKVVADSLNQGGRICKEEGLQLLYHNHDMEFLPVEGQIPFDVIMPMLNPEWVNIELDLYWITKGNQSAEAYIKKYPGRYPVFHVKDMDKTPDRSFACLGDGIIDFPSIFKLNDIAGAKHFIVEHDQPEDPEACVRKGAAYLSSISF